MNPNNIATNARLIDLSFVAAIFVSTFLVFWFSPVHQVTDSNYSMLLSDCLLRDQTFALDACGLQRLQPIPLANYITNGGAQQLEIVRDHVYYYFPIGSSVLSIPYVALARLFSVSPRNADGSFNQRGELRIELALAAILMAALCCVFFITGRMLLPLGWSLVTAFGGALGTQIWSTASRGLWSHTWSVLLTGIVVYLLVAHDTGNLRFQPVLLASLLAWLYFVRPTNSVVIIGVTVFVFLCCRQLVKKFLVTGALWLTVFVYYSWHNFGRLFPNYYRANRLSFDTFLVAFEGHLISPSRGLFVFVPVFLFVLFLLVWYWRYVPLTRLKWLGICIVIITLISISGFPHWWGGASFGPRFSTDIVPWFVLLAIIGIRGMLNWRLSRQSRESRVSRVYAAQLTCGVLLLAASVFINARGALDLDTWRWTPGDVSQGDEKLWDWREPQFLAGLVSPRTTYKYLPMPVETQINFNQPDQSTRYLGNGWSEAERNFRWTNAHEASLVFALDEPEDLTLNMKVLPFIREVNWKQQRVFVTLNSVQIESLLLNQNHDTQISIPLPATLVRRENIIKFELPDCVSPETVENSSDQRLLGFAVYWIRLDRAGISVGASLRGRTFFQ